MHCNPVYMFKTSPDTNGGKEGCTFSRRMSSNVDARMGSDEFKLFDFPCSWRACRCFMRLFTKS